jgi:phosphatidylserine decarboxylase
MFAPLLTGVVAALVLALALAWKWELGLRRVVLGVFVLGVVAALGVWALDALVGIGSVASAALTAVLTVILALMVLAWRFYRDPERTPPPEEGVVVSPADGKIVYVRRSQGGTLPVATKVGRDFQLEELTKTQLRSGDAHVIGIGMSFLEVHVNRAPVDGVVTLRRHFPGQFGSLSDPKMAFENERATTVIETSGGLQVAVVQIASRLVRQIASYVEVGERIARGQRIGIIRFGSQVDLVLPVTEGLEVCVTPGDWVRAGESVLARMTQADEIDPPRARPR